MRPPRKKAPHSEKRAIFGKMLHTWKNAPHLKKCSALGKMRHARKNATNFEKCHALGIQKAPHLEKINIMLKNCHLWPFVAIYPKQLFIVHCSTLLFSKLVRSLVEPSRYIDCEKCLALKMHHIQKKVPPLEKCATLVKMRHTWKNASHSQKSATLGKMCHT